MNLRDVIVGVTGFELATSWSLTKRSNQTELHPDININLYKSG